MKRTPYLHLPSNNTAELEPWYYVHVELIGPNSKYIGKPHPVDTIIQSIIILICMMIIDRATVCFKKFEIPICGFDEVTGRNDEDIYTYHLPVLASCLTTH